MNTVDSKRRLTVRLDRRTVLEIKALALTRSTSTNSTVESLVQQALEQLPDQERQEVQQLLQLWLVVD